MICFAFGQVRVLFDGCEYSHMDCLGSFKSCDGMLITALSRKLFLFYFLPLCALIRLQ